MTLLVLLSKVIRSDQLSSKLIVEVYVCIIRSEQEQLRKMRL